MAGMVGAASVGASAGAVGMGVGGASGVGVGRISGQALQARCAYSLSVQVLVKAS